MSVSYKGPPGVYLRGFAKCMGCSACTEFALSISDLPMASTAAIIPASWTLRNGAPWCERCSSALAAAERSAKEAAEREKASAERALAALADRGGYR